MERTGVVVLHFRHWPEVAATLDALLAQDPPPDRVVLVDNDSPPASVDAIRDRYPDVEVVEAGGNLGYAGGMNIGLRRLLDDVDAVLLLTHEVVLAPGALDALVDRLDLATDVAAVGPVVATHEEPDRVFSAGGWIQERTWDTRHHRDPIELDAWEGQPPRRAEWLDGCCWLVRTSVLRQVGLLDEGFFLYFEELDLQRRVVEAGWVLECVPAAVAHQSSGGKPGYLWTRNRLRVLARHAPRRALARDLARVTYRAGRQAVGRGRSGVDLDARAQLAGVRDFLLGRTGPPPDRHHPGRADP